VRLAQRVSGIVLDSDCNSRKKCEGAVLRSPVYIKGILIFYSLFHPQTKAKPHASQMASPPNLPSLPPYHNPYSAHLSSPSSSPPPQPHSPSPSPPPPNSAPAPQSVSPSPQDHLRFLSRLDSSPSRPCTSMCTSGRLAWFARRS
jgi:hypothetical protein